MLRTARASVRR